MDEKTLYTVGRQLVPEMDSLLKKRYRILQAIHAAGPIGRRSLADLLHVSERDVRNETTLLQEQQLIEIQQRGMICTKQGHIILEQLKSHYYELSGLAKKEQQLAEKLGIEKVIIIPGAFSQQAAKILLGKEIARLVTKLALPNSKIALTGGSSVAAAVPYLHATPTLSSATFIAARGGMGEEMTLQANVLVAQFAAACKAKYKTLFLPEFLSEQAYVAMKAEPSVQEMIRLYEEVNIVLHGIGTAQEMAEKRGSTDKDKELLEERGAVGEAFGYYFNEAGEIVHQIRTICIQPEHIRMSENVLAIAGGAHKAQAIEAYFKQAAQHTIFITDEEAAQAIL